MCERYIKYIPILVFSVMLLMLLLVFANDSDTDIENMEKQIKICINNGGVPNTYIRKDYNSDIPVVECKWKCEK